MKLIKVYHLLGSDFEGRRTSDNNALTLAGHGQALLLNVPLTHAYAHIYSPRREALGFADVVSAER